MNASKPEKGGQPKPMVPNILAATAAAVAGFAAVYASLSPPDNAGAPAAAVAEAQPEGGRAAEGGLPSAGQITGFVRRNPPSELADIAFINGDGQEVKLSQFRGKAVLLNLWATWCAPCRHEMPSLDRLQKDMGSAAFEVVALAVDRTGLENARKFLSETKVEALKVYADPSARTGSQLKAVGLPTTILIDKDGRERGRLPGPAAWDSAEAKALIEAALK